MLDPGTASDNADYTNPTHVQTHLPDQLVNDRHQYFLYDQMNRQKVVDAVDSQGTIVAGQGHILSYDGNGNRTGDSYYGKQLLEQDGQHAG